ARGGRGVHGGQGLASAGIVCSGASLLLAPFLGIFAAIVIPSLLRARVSANEATTIGDIRQVVAAEASYSERNGGHFGTLECLNAPQNCLGAGASTTPFIAPELLLPTRSGFNRSFHPGRDAGYREGHPHQYLQSFAYVASPVTLGRTGVRTFCGDSSGRICFVRSPEEMKVDYGLCPKACEDLR